MSDFMGIVEMIDAQLLRRHNNTATEFFEAGQQAERERIVKWMEKFIPDGHLEHEECDDCLVIRTVIAMIKEE